MRQDSCQFGRKFPVGNVSSFATIASNFPVARPDFLACAHCAIPKQSPAKNTKIQNDVALQFRDDVRNGNKRTELLISSVKILAQTPASTDMTAVIAPKYARLPTISVLDIKFSRNATIPLKFHQENNFLIIFSIIILSEII